jgi:GNAT superfamily N-acetyltransferase
MEIHKLRYEDWPILKRLILDSLADSPDAFSDTLNGALSYPDAEWRGLPRKYSCTQGEVAYGLIDNQEPCGILIGGVANLGHMWVSPRVRRNGNGKKLLDTFLTWARKRHSSVVHLYVTEQTSAVNFYESMGFKSTGDRMKLRTGSEKMMIEMELKL